MWRPNRRKIPNNQIEYIFLNIDLVVFCVMCMSSYRYPSDCFSSESTIHNNQIKGPISLKL
ncbi:hypothetical protein KFK09_019827 [Dendrobium nobile]|uniref:Uncharacterized protein n=1 Tax=Dendrobium nobile TaxID=94219 RepID=A0A8T3ARJ4_DENNO|nr:hypothetical protein KFK09_019827 [Dendrobium nobile]